MGAEAAQVRDARKSRTFERWTAAIARWEWALLLAPLLLASLARPFGLWDYLTAPNIYLHEKAFTFRNVVANYGWNVFGPAPTVRPTTALLLNTEYWAFGGEFWIWYLVRWTAKILAAYLVDGVLQSFEIDLMARLAVLGVWLFHPVNSDLMLISADGWVAFSAVVLLTLLLWRQKPECMFNLAAFTLRRYLCVFTAWFLLLGTKEVGLVTAAVYTAAAALTSVSMRGHALRKATLRLSPFVVVTLLWAWKVKSAFAAFPSANVTASEGPRIRLSTLIGHGQFLTAAIPFALGLGLLVAGLLWLFWRIRRGGPNRHFVVFLAAAGVGSLLFVSVTQSAAARYVTPALLMMTLLGGFALNDLGRARRWICAAVALLFPILGAADTYPQALAYQQYFYETTDALHVAEQASALGYRPAITGDNDDVPLENQGTIRLFFEKYGPAFYGRTAKDVVDLRSGPVQASKIALISHIGADAALAKWAVALQGFEVDDTFQVERGDYGVLEWIAANLGKLGLSLRMRPFPAYDAGAPSATETPFFVVSLLSRRGKAFSAADSSGEPVDTEWANYTQKVQTRSTLAAGEGKVFRAGPGDTVKLAVPIDEEVSSRLSYQGAFKITGGGTFIFGVTDKNGRDVWNTAAPATGEWRELPVPPVLSLDRGRTYYLFIYGTFLTEGDVAIRGLRFKKSAGAIILPALRRFGAVAR
jgi:hypothetical protein